SCKWTNKQRTLTFCSRGISAVHRHLLEDMKKLMPHSVAEVKWEKSLSLDNIPEAAEMKNCNNVMYFEARKHSDLYMYLAKAVGGPTVKFRVLDAIPMLSTNFLGNCIRNSRPLLVFSKEFGEEPHLKLIKELFVQIIGCPQYHPKSRPFHDHVLLFAWANDGIYVRSYQIYDEQSSNVISRQQLREIGPRFFLVPLRIFDDAFRGKTLWQLAESKRQELKKVNKA
uniref:Ribosome biogenesis protein BRX1 homolog n=1 Tax=Dermatophagoides pteronyssinus TaxID=6956 RepID=A0A6P6Y7D7_DERPT